VKRRRDTRLVTVVAAATITFAAGLAVHYVQSQSSFDAAVPPVPEVDTLGTRQDRLLHQQFQQAVAMLEGGNYEYAIEGFHAVLKIAPNLPEAHVNMGYAMLGLGKYEVALDFFDSATDLRPAQANAYYGMAVAAEQLEDLTQALTMMETYLHLAADDEPYRRKADAAIWEWRSALAEREQ